LTDEIEERKTGVWNVGGPFEKRYRGRILLTCVGGGGRDSDMRGNQLEVYGMSGWQAHAGEVAGLLVAGVDVESIADKDSRAGLVGRSLLRDERHVFVLELSSKR
jgi:hypothetical protein